MGGLRPPEKLALDEKLGVTNRPQVARGPAPELTGCLLAGFHDNRPHGQAEGDAENDGK
jgi:hypothetical protein